MKVNGTTTTCTRFYGDTAVRTTTGGLTWQASDHHGTAQLTINATTLATTRRRLDPFGNPRSTTTPDWPTNHGFVNGTTDPSGLTHLGAREYDPTTGRFTTVDPILDRADPQQTNGYTYADNNPATADDPSGLRVCLESCGGEDDLAALKVQVQHRLPGVPNDGGSGWGGNPRPGHNKKFNTGAAITYSHPGSGVHKAAISRPSSGAGKSVPANMKTGDDASTSDVSSNACGKSQCDVPVCEDGGSGDCTRADIWMVAVIFTVAFDSVLEVAAFIVLPPAAPITEPFIGATEVAEVTAETEAIELAEADAAVSARLARSRCSFAPDTPVLMADGTTKPIKNVKVDDQVKAADPTNHTETSEPVTKLHDNLDTDFADLTITDTLGHPATIHTTQNHPFWDATTQQWTNAAQLRPGDHLHTTTGDTATVTTVTTFTGQHHMLNLTIANIHTYYVIAGTTPVLVHNIGCDEFAANFQAKNGGQLKTFNGPGGSHLPMGPYRPGGPGTKAVDEDWFHHTVAVKDGMVYDQWHPDGVGVDEYKTFFDYGDDIDFGF